MTRQGIYWAKIRIYEYSYATKKHSLVHVKQATLTSASKVKLDKVIAKWNRGNYRVKILSRGMQPGVQWSHP